MLEVNAQNVTHAVMLLMMSPNAALPGSAAH
jgi:hypothetical protein